MSRSRNSPSHTAFGQRRDQRIRRDKAAALVMAAMRQADSYNVERLRREWPDVWDELKARHGAEYGLLPGENK